MPRTLRLTHTSLVMLAALALNLGSASSSAAQAFALHDGDTVVFYGDSITAQHLYTQYAEDFVLTRYPSLHIHFVNAGVPGDTVYGGYAGTMAERVQRDVAPYHPAMITVMLGMNDGGYVPPDPKIDAVFQKGYHDLLDALRKAAPAAIITFITTTPYDEITHGTEFPGYAQTVAQNAKDVMDIASSAGDQRQQILVDFHGPVVKALERANTQFPQLAPLLVPDRIHPSATAHWIVAAALLRGWHVDPVVSRLTLKTGSADPIETMKTKVTDLHENAQGWTWKQQDEALPLPLDLNDAMTNVLLGVSDVASLDQQMLRVEGIASGSYELLIDAKPVGIFTGQQLREGVNLALYKTPMLEQSRDIDWSEQRRTMLDQARFLLTAEIKVTPSTSVAKDKLQQGEDELATEIRTRIEPKQHAFELRRQTP